MTRVPWMRLGNLVPAVLAGWEKQIDSPMQRLRQLWEATVGPQVALHARPLALRNGILLVSVDSPVWAAELQQFHRERILGACNSALGGDGIRALRFITRPPSPPPNAGEDTHAEG